MGSIGENSLKVDQKLFKSWPEDVGKAIAYHAGHKVVIRNVYEVRDNPLTMVVGVSLECDECAQVIIYCVGAGKDDYYFGQLSGKTYKAYREKHNVTTDKAYQEKHGVTTEYRAPVMLAHWSAA